MGKIENMFKPDRVIRQTPKGAAGYDNARENIDPHIKTKVVSTKEMTLSDGSAAGFVKNDADGVLSGGNAGGGAGLWQRAGSVLSPATAGDSIETTGAGVIEGLNPYNSTTADLGSVTFQWRNLFLSDNATIGGNITLTGTVDGIDIATDVGANTAHAATTTGNPHVVLLDEIGNPGGATAISMGSNDLKFQFSNPASDGFNIEAIGAFSGDILHVHQHTGNPGAVHLAHFEAEDIDVLPLCLTHATGNQLRLSNVVDSIETTFKVNSSHDLTIDPTSTGKVIINSVLDVQGNITTSGTVDGIDIATDVAANTTARHTQDTDTALGSGAVAADHGTAATDQIINVSYGTGAAPAANTTTIGSIYITHEA